MSGVIDRGRRLPATGDIMHINALRSAITTAGGGKNALDCAEVLLAKIRQIESEPRCARLLMQLLKAKEPGDFLGRILEVNFAARFIECGVALEYGVRQGMSGDIDFAWKVDAHHVHIELKLLTQDRKTKESINKQIEEWGASATHLQDDTSDIVRLQRDLIEKSSIRKFNPTPSNRSINLVGIDVTELQLGAVDLCDCVLAAGGNTMAAQHFNPAGRRHTVVGVFETIAPEGRTSSQQRWIADVQRIPPGAPHPRNYIHGALFLFREPQGNAAFSYDLRAAMVWNRALVSAEVARRICAALHRVIPSALHSIAPSAT